MYEDNGNVSSEADDQIEELKLNVPSSSLTWQVVAATVSSLISCSNRLRNTRNNIVIVFADRGSCFSFPRQSFKLSFGSGVRTCTRRLTSKHHTEEIKRDAESRVDIIRYLGRDVYVN